MKNDRLGVNVLNIKVIPNVDPALAKKLSLKPEHRSLKTVTSDCDNVAYIALGEATKTADVTVVYGRSMYASAANASTKLTGEMIGVTADPSPAEVNSGLSVIARVIEEEASLCSANEDDSIVYFVHVMSRTGNFLSEQANTPEGETIAYLIAPPLEAMVGLNVAMRAADVQMGIFYGLPSETNFGNVLLTGSQSACKAVCSTFKRVIQNITNNPLSY